MNKLVMILAASMLVVGIVAAHLWMELRDEREQNAEWRTQAAVLETAQPAFAATTVAAPEPEPAPVASAVTAPVNAAHSPTEAAATPSAPADRARTQLAAGISAMMATPEGRELTLSQIRRRLPQQYPDVAKELNLTPEETEQFFDLLAKQAADAAGDALGLLGGSGERPSVQDLQRRAMEREQAGQAQLTALLGNRLPQWEQYQSTQTTRQQVNRLRNTLGTGSNALSEAQSAPLITALAAEQARINQEMRSWSASTGRNSPTPVEDQLQRTAEANRRLASVAAYHLNPQQLESYQRQQEQELNAARLTVRAISGMGGQGRAAPAGP